jgi:hypothetical protein
MCEKSLPESEWPRMVQLAMAITESWMGEKGSVMPFLLTMNEEGKAVIMLLSLSDMRQDVKDRVESIMVRLVRAGAREICFVSEAWSIEGVEPGDDLERVRRLCASDRLSEDPRRKEVVNVMYESVDRALQAVREVVREPAPRFSEEGWRVVGTEGRTEGRFADIFHKARFLSRRDN